MLRIPYYVSALAIAAVLFNALAAAILTEGCGLQAAAMAATIFFAGAFETHRYTPERIEQVPLVARIPGYFIRGLSFSIPSLLLGSLFGLSAE